MYDHRQNQVTEPRSVSVPNLPAENNQRRIYDADDAESRVSTDSDLDLTDFDDEEEDDEEYDGYEEQQRVENRSTFSGVLMRKLQTVEQEREQPRVAVAHADDDDGPMENVRPALLAVADDSFSAKMRRVLKWTHSLPSEAVSESSDSSSCSPAMSPMKAILPISSSTESRKRRLSDALFPPDSNTIANKRPRIATAFSPPSAPGSPFFSSAPRLYPYPFPIPNANISASRPPPTSTTALLLPHIVINTTTSVNTTMPKVSCDYTTISPSVAATAAPMAIHVAMAVNSNHHHHHHHHTLTDSLHVCYGP